MRFRKRITIFPGFCINLSKSGISTTIGPKGFNVNFNKTGTYLNTGLPGTGLYDRRKISYPNNNDAASGNAEPYIPSSPTSTDNTKEIKSKDFETINSPSLEELRKSLSEAFNERNELIKEISIVNKEIVSEGKKKILSYILLFGFIYNPFKKNIIEKNLYLEEIQIKLSECFVDIDLKFDDVFDYKYKCLAKSFEDLSGSAKIWDVTSATEEDPRSKSAALISIRRSLVNFNISNIAIIHSSNKAFHLQNKNGGDIYIYPTFALVISNTRDFAVIDLRDIEILYTKTNFVEEEEVPLDSVIVNYTWAKVNKNGTPDKRFRDNYQIPEVKYGMIKILSESGLYEMYLISNPEKADNFVNDFKEYQFLLKHDETSNKLLLN